MARDELPGHLIEQLERQLATADDPIPRIESLERHPWGKSTSFALEAWHVRLASGRQLELLRKDLSRAGMLPDSQRAKPEFLYQPLRELAAYRSMLPGGIYGPPQCYAQYADADAGECWIILERIRGVELYQVPLEIWQHAAQWLAEFHRFWRTETAWRTAPGPWLRWDVEYGRIWRDRALEALTGQRRADRLVQWLHERHEPMLRFLLATPQTFLHGEFYASNVLVDLASKPVRVAPVDWEMAAVGPGLMDLAALVAGNWQEQQRLAIAQSYYAASATGESWTDFLLQLDCCRLCIAVQWLGWAADWQPPAEHAYDWLAEANGLIERLRDVRW